MLVDLIGRGTITSLIILIFLCNRTNAAPTGHLDDTTDSPPTIWPWCQDSSIPTEASWEIVIYLAYGTAAWWLTIHSESRRIARYLLREIVLDSAAYVDPISYARDRALSIQGPIGSLFRTALWLTSTNVPIPRIGFYYALYAAARTAFDNCLADWALVQLCQHDHVALREAALLHHPDKPPSTSTPYSTHLSARNAVGLSPWTRDEPFMANLWISHEITHPSNVPLDAGSLVGYTFTFAHFRRFLDACMERDITLPTSVLVQQRTRFIDEILTVFDYIAGPTEEETERNFDPTFHGPITPPHGGQPMYDHIMFERGRYAYSTGKANVPLSLTDGTRLSPITYVPAQGRTKRGTPRKYTRPPTRVVPSRSSSTISRPPPGTYPGWREYWHDYWDHIGQTPNASWAAGFFARSLLRRTFSTSDTSTSTTSNSSRPPPGIYDGWRDDWHAHWDSIGQISDSSWTAGFFECSLMYTHMAPSDFIFTSDSDSRPPDSPD